MNEEFKVIINKNQETINAYRKYFERLWAQAKWMSKEKLNNVKRCERPTTGHRPVACTGARRL